MTATNLGVKVIPATASITDLRAHTDQITENNCSEALPLSVALYMWLHTISDFSVSLQSINSASKTVSQ